LVAQDRRVSSSVTSRAPLGAMRFYHPSHRPCLQSLSDSGDHDRAGITACRLMSNWKRVSPIS